MLGEWAASVELLDCAFDVVGLPRHRPPPRHRPRHPRRLPIRYRAGEFCKVAYEGMTTTATNGRAIRCVDIDNDGHPHWVYA